MTATYLDACRTPSGPTDGNKATLAGRMWSDRGNGNWDFAAAIDLIHTTPNLLQTADTASAKIKSNLYSSTKQAGTESIATTLGNFDAIFSALGLPLCAHTVSKVLHGADGPKLPPTPTTVVSKRAKKKTPRPSLQNSDEELREERAFQDVIKLRGGRATDQSLVELETSRLAHSEGEDVATGLQSATRRDIIGSLLDTPLRPANGGDASPRRSRAYLTPASIKPAKAFQTIDGELSISPSSLSTEKIVRLMDMLFQRFPEDAKYLSALYHPTTDSITSQTSQTLQSGIHVFVDISNILIGFHDTLKLRRGLRKDFRLPRQRVSFSKLALILERGRPTAKRELVGSDKLESILEAEVIGYKTNILERVTKVKELTQRQKFFMRLDGKSGASSGSDAENGRTTQIRRVEQGVDEILHLKMSHSLLDTDSPSTIVLATGDAAEAEYSDGFLAMVERALERKWKVELVAFKGNMSRAYRHEGWTSRWGSAFKIIELDDYAELLHLE